MGTLPMSITGVPPVSFLLSFSRIKEETEETTDMGKMPMGLMAKMAMLHTGETPVPRLLKLSRPRADDEEGQGDAPRECPRTHLFPMRRGLPRRPFCERSMGILPMSITGILPVSLLLLFSCFKEETTDMGKMPMRHMAKMAMLHSKQPRRPE
jgi:hypothetical protein